MKIENLSLAYAKYQGIIELKQKVASVNGTGLGVTIGGAYQDNDMLSAVRDSVIAELNRRICARIDELKAMGLEFPL